MFGGLEVKGASSTSSSSKGHPSEGEDKSNSNNDTISASTNSGFSFLASATTATSDPHPAQSTAEDTAGDAGEPATAAPSSGFSFMTTTESNTDAVKTNEETNTGAVGGGSSGFSFMSNNAGNDNDKKEDVEEVKESQTTSKTLESTAGGMSGFSFMTSIETKEVNDTATGAIGSATTENPISSSFNFISSTAKEAEKPNDSTNPTTDVSESLPQTNESIFSMLSSNLGPSQSSTTTTGPDSDPGIVTDSKPSSTNNSNNATLPWSGLTMKDSSSTTNDSKPPLASSSTFTAPPLVPAATTATPTTDIFMQSNPSQPTGSGVVFGGAAKPKTVKKRARAKKIGVGASASSTITTIPAVSNIHLSNAPSSTATSSVLPEPQLTTATEKIATSTTNENAYTGTTSAMNEESNSTSENQKTSSRKLSEEAEEATNRAEEFISNKLSSTYIGGRYSGDTTIVEDYGDSTTGTTPQEEKAADTAESEEYQKARAAAEEAKNITKRGGFMSGGMAGGFGGFFKRGFSNNGAAAGSVGGGASVSSSMMSNSSHSNTNQQSEKVMNVIEKKKEWKAPTYGQSNNDEDTNDDEQSYTYNDESTNHLERERREEQLRRELDLEKEMRVNERRLMEKQMRQDKGLDEEEEGSQEAVARERLMEEERLRKVAEEEERQRILEEEEARKKNPASELKRIIHQFSLLSQTTTCSIAELREERKGLLEKQCIAEKQERLATQQIAQAEKQQLDAAEKEDFDLADRLAAVIEQHQEEQQEKDLILQEINGLIKTLDVKQHSKGEKLLAHFNDVQQRLSNFLDEQEHSDIRDSTELLQKFESDTKRLATECERLSADLKNIERDEGFVEEERTELEATISEKTADIEVKRDEAGSKLEVINSEIEDLRKQLAEKEMEAAEVKLELHGHEESIDNIRSTFSRQLARLSKKEVAVKESRKEWESEDDAYKASRLEHESEVTAHSEALLAHDKLLSQIKAEISIAEQLTDVVAKDVVNDAVDSDNVINDDVTAAQAEVLKCEAAAEEANEVLTAARAHIDALVEEISVIDVRLPILEAEKKDAASKRDFKAAGKASKTIKEMKARKEVCEEELNGDAIDRQANAQKVVDECAEVLNDKKEILLQKEKEGGRQRMIALVKKIIKLEQLREDVCISNGFEDRDGESISVVGGFVLDSEIAALVSEGEDLDAKFGGWNEIMMECADADNEEDTEANNAEIDENAGGSEETPAQVEEEESCLQEDEDEDLSYASNDPAEKEASLKRYKEIMVEIESIESKIEAAIEEEDYDAAADLDDEVNSLKEELKTLGISESDLSADESKESSQCTEKSYAIVSNDVEQEMENHDDNL